MDASLQKRAEQLATEFASQARTAEDLNGLMRQGNRIFGDGEHSFVSPCRSEG